MAGLGLPRVAENILTTLLAENVVTSWKLTGEGETTVFILRLCSPTGQMSQPLQPTGWRRKARSQLLRDQRRAQLRQAERQRTANTDGTHSNSTGATNDMQANTIDNNQPECATVTEHNEGEIDVQQKASDIINITETAVTLENNTLGDVTTTRDSVPCLLDLPRAPSSDNLGHQTADNSDMHVEPMACITTEVCSGDDQLTASETFSAVDSGSVTSAVCEIDVLEQLAIDCGMSLAHIQDCVNDLKDTAAQNKHRRDTLIGRLKNINRNKTLTTIVLDRRAGRETLIAESHDFVLTCSCSSDLEFGWYFKLPGDSAPFQYYLQTWPAVNASKYIQEKRLMSENLTALTYIVRSLLE